MSNTWNSAYDKSPKGSSPPEEGYLRIQEMRTDFRERITNEHDTYADGTVGADGTAINDFAHLPGSAASLYQEEEPTNHPNGGVLLSYDAGRLWITKNTNKKINVHDGSAFITGVGLPEGSPSATSLTLTETTTQAEVYAFLLPYIPDTDDTVELRGNPVMNAIDASSNKSSLRWTASYAKKTVAGITVYWSEGRLTANSSSLITLLVTSDIEHAITSTEDVLLKGIVVAGTVTMVSLDGYIKVLEI